MLFETARRASIERGTWRGAYYEKSYWMACMGRATTKTSTIRAHIRYILKRSIGLEFESSRKVIALGEGTY